LILETANRDEAAAKARRLYADLVLSGWDSLLKRHRPKPPAPETSATITFGQLFDLIQSRNLIPSKTLNGYIPRLRRIISEIKGIKAGRKRFGSRNGKAWRGEVDAVALSAVTPADIRKWKSVRIAKAGNNELLRRQYTTSVNSTLRQARSIFAEKVLRHLPEVPRPHLFEGIEFEPKVDTRFFGAGVDAPTLLRRALKELEPEQLKAFLLGIALGLRRKEADLLQWDSFDFAACTVEVRPTEHHSLKTEESAALMVLDPEIMALFQGWHAQRHGPFVLESEHLPRPSARYHYYRCDTTFDSLVDWLRLQGITGNKPFHVLRKLFGSLIVAKDGIFAASSALRHTSLASLK
jgi:integrase